ncbi:MAG: hypothetical protein C5B50_05200 [Verrucomicrobia bacterium]|nr:MAG: hypothetical protein C5B50_05200 [Verrucomicrobiota bacterium]
MAIRRLLKALAVLVAFAISLLGCRDQRALTPGDTNEIRNLVQKAQRKHVRESYGELAYQCFTEQDYQAFDREQRAHSISSNLKANRKFMEAVLSLQQKSPADRALLINDLRHPLRPSWAQLGQVSKEGQTEAGRRAELDIANAVADLVSQLCELSPGEISNVFNQR